MRRALPLALALLTFPAAAETMSLYLRNDSGRDAAVELRSRDRNKVWPGDSQVWLVPKGERKAVTVDCEAGERLCYGGWARGNDAITYGIGPDDTELCRDCCTACVQSDMFDVILGPPR